MFDNHNKLYKVQASNEIEACREAFICLYKENNYESDLNDWWNEIDKETLEDVLDSAWNSEYLVSPPLQIS